MVALLAPGAIARVDNEDEEISTLVEADITAVPKGAVAPWSTPNTPERVSTIPIQAQASLSLPKPPHASASSSHTFLAPLPVAPKDKTKPILTLTDLSKASVRDKVLHYESPNGSPVGSPTVSPQVSPKVSPNIRSRADSAASTSSQVSIASTTTQAPNTPPPKVNFESALTKFYEGEFKSVRNRSKDPKVLAADPQHLAWIEETLANNPLVLSVCRGSNTSKKGIERTLNDLMETKLSDRYVCADDIYEIPIFTLHEHLVNNRVVIKDSDILPRNLLKALSQTKYAPAQVSFRFGQHPEHGWFHITRNRIHHLPE